MAETIERVLEIFSAAGWAHALYNEGRQLGLYSPDSGLALNYWPSTGTWMAYAKTWQAPAATVLKAWQGGRFQRHGGELATCERCGEDILWCITAKGARMPCNLDGNSHFKFCKDSVEQRKKSENRRKYPWVGEILDEYREVFGSGVKVISITED